MKSRNHSIFIDNTKLQNIRLLKEKSDMTIPDFTGEHWFNSKQLTKKDLENKVVLVTFWTYSCVNCQRTIPFLRDLWQKYKDLGLIIIGVHSPEFGFEKDHRNISKVIKDLEISWPVVQDNSFRLWKTFENQYWPSTYLFDQGGEIVHSQAGTTKFLDLESKILEHLSNIVLEKRLVEEGSTLSEYFHEKLSIQPTPELYCGYFRGRISNWSGYKFDTEYNYVTPDVLPEDTMALHGKFVAKEEFVESTEEDSQILLNFKGTEVNLVLEPVGKNAIIKVETLANVVSENRNLLDQKEIRIKQPTLYNIIERKFPLKGTLSVGALNGNFRAYTFSFSGYL